MNQFTAELLKLLIMAVMCVATYAVRQYVIPYVKSKLNSEQLATAQEMAKMFVYMAEQSFGEKTGAERKQIVKDALQEALKNAGISLTEQFADDMIEAAVKGMKIAESGGTLEIEAVGEITETETQEQEGGA